MTPSIIAPINEFSIENPLPYFQLPTQNSPLGFGNSRDGRPMGDGGNPPHGNGRPPRGGNKPSRRRSAPPSEGGPPSGRILRRRGGGKFLVGGVGVPFGAP